MRQGLRKQQQAHLFAILILVRRHPRQVEGCRVGQCSGAHNQGDQAVHRADTGRTFSGAPSLAPLLWRPLLFELPPGSPV
eukprot:SAG25_NODE_1685_length_2555_cov_1.684039_5_plen_80_part_00